MKSLFLISLMMGIWSIFFLNGFLLGQAKDKGKSKDYEEEELFKTAEELVFVASKKVQKLEDVPAIVDVITAKDFQIYGFRTVADAVRTLSGFYTSYDRETTYLGVRGISMSGDYNTRVLVLLDGHKINENWAASSLIDDQLGIDISMVERIEVMRGPSSVFYGTNGFFAIINIITKEPSKDTWFKIGGEVGSFGSYKALAQTRHAFKFGLKYHLGFTFIDKAGGNFYFKEHAGTTPTGGWTGDGMDRERQYQGFFRLSYKDLTVFGNFSNFEKHIPTAPFESVFNDRNTIYGHTRGFVEIKYQKEFLKMLDFMARAYYDMYRYQDKLPYDMDYGYDLLRDKGYADYYGGEVKMTLTLEKKGIVKNLLTIGSEALYNEIKSVVYWESDPSLNRINIPTFMTMVSAYIQEQLEIYKVFNLIVGCRYDYNTVFQSKLSFRGALIFNVKSINSSFKLAYNQGFRNPSVYEAFFQDNVDLIANKNLEAEQIDNFDFITEVRYKKFLKATMNIFFFSAKNLLRQTTVSVGGEERLQYQNIDSYKSLGVEFSFRLNLWDRFYALGNFTYQKAFEENFDEYLFNSPQFMFNICLSYAILKDKLFVSTVNRFVDRRLAYRDALTDHNVFVDPYFITSINVLYKDVVKGLDLQFSIENIFDYQYSDPAVSESLSPITMIPQNGRTFYFRATYQY